jgi:hypothetical protein
MATNLRLRPDAEEALRAEARRTHRSQQDVLRDALDRYLGLGDVGERGDRHEPGVHDLAAGGRVRPPRTAYRRVEPDPAVTARRTSLELLERDDRF